ncbi:hypothetical protein [Rasiella sp. SM2506]|uniref:hypothetical protein n=1 Tax=Rasiella sp. SM2506 TaxID=3423914 RepID=UPI003D78C97D
MTELQTLVIYALLSGSTIFLGGLLSHYFGIYFKAGLVKAEIIHGSIAFGGGILLAAVALVLIPEGMRPLSLISMSICFLIGAITFFLLIDI